MDSFYNPTKLIDNIQHDPSQDQLHCINSSEISSSFLIKSVPSIQNYLETLLRVSSITNSEVPNNQINIENLSDNPTFKENTPHIHANIDTFKRKPESNDMLHFQKLTSLRLNLTLSKVL